MQYQLIFYSNLENRMIRSWSFLILQFMSRSTYPVCWFRLSYAFYFIYEQKSAKHILFPGEITSQRNEIKDIERSIRNMHNDMVKLNQLIHKNRDKQDTLQQDNILMENDFIATLKVGDENNVFVFVLWFHPLKLISWYFDYRKICHPRKSVEHHFRVELLFGFFSIFFMPNLFDLSRMEIIPRPEKFY